MIVLMIVLDVLLLFKQSLPPLDLGLSSVLTLSLELVSFLERLSVDDPEAPPPPAVL